MSESKASLVRLMKERGLPVPKGAKVPQLKHRLKHWRSPQGFLMRLGLPVKGDSLANLMEPEKLYWVPDSDFAAALLNTQVVLALTRQTEVPTSAILLDVPHDF